MGRPVKGDVVVLPFPFSDLSASKKRPALVLASVAPYNDLILCMITSKGGSDTTAIEIGLADFTSGSLPRQSMARPARLFTANSSIVLRTAGSLSDTKIDEIVGTVVS